MIEPKYGSFYQNNKNLILVKENIMAKYTNNPASLKKSPILDYKRYVQFTFLVFHETESPSSSVIFSPEMMNKLSALRKSNTPLPTDKKLVAVVPFMRYAENKVSPKFYESPYYEFLIGNAKITDENLKGYGHFTPRFDPVRGLNRERHFVSVITIVDPDQTYSHLNYLSYFIFDITFHY